MASKKSDKHRKVSTATPGKSRTRQADRQITELDKLMPRYYDQGVLPTPQLHRQVYYGEFNTTRSFHDAMNQITQAEQIFQALPSKLRKHCNNDPAELIDLVSDPANDELLVQLGYKKPVAEGSPPAEVPEEPLGPSGPEEPLAAGPPAPSSPPSEEE